MLCVSLFLSQKSHDHSCSVRYIIAHLPRNIHITANSAPPAKLFARGPPGKKRQGRPARRQKLPFFAHAKKQLREGGEGGEGGTLSLQNPPAGGGLTCPPPRGHTLSRSRNLVCRLFAVVFASPSLSCEFFLALWRPLAAVFRDPAGLVSTTPGSGAGCCVCVCVRPTGPPLPLPRQTVL